MAGPAVAPVEERRGRSLPPEGLWARIAAATASDGQRHRLRRSAPAWRAAAAGMAALAASLGWCCAAAAAQPARPRSSSSSRRGPADGGDARRRWQKMKVVASWDPAARATRARYRRRHAGGRAPFARIVGHPGRRQAALARHLAGGEKDPHATRRRARAAAATRRDDRHFGRAPRRFAEGQPTGPVIASGPLDRA